MAKRRLTAHEQAGIVVFMKINYPHTDDYVQLLLENQTYTTGKTVVGRWLSKIENTPTQVAIEWCNCFGIDFLDAFDRWHIAYNRTTYGFIQSQIAVAKRQTNDDDGVYENKPIL
jgi:hypothetical protein